MTTSGPAADRVVRAVRAWLGSGHVAAGVPLVVACSGGADSVALAWAVRAVVGGRGQAARSGDAEGSEGVGAVGGSGSVGGSGGVGAVGGSGDVGGAGPVGSHALSAAVVDHRLQPGSATVARAAADTLRQLGYRRVDVLPVTVSGPGGVEAAARTARYTALRAHASSIGPGTAVLLAHTADDQAETVLLGLARGSGPRSIAGMRPWRAPWGRPLLSVRRADTEAACAAAGLTPWQDPQNADPAFTRVRLRHEALPLLDRVLGGGVIPALARTADLMADDLEALDEVAAVVLGRVSYADDNVAPGSRSTDAVPFPMRTHGGDGGDGGDGARLGSLDCTALAEWPAAIRRRVLRSWAADAAVTELTYQHLTRMDGLVTDGRTGAAVRLPGGWDAVRRGRALVLEPVTA